MTTDTALARSPDWWLLIAIAAYVGNLVGWGIYICVRIIHGC